MYEPRVEINSIVIDTNVNEGVYVINLSVRIPSLNKDVDIRSLLSNDGYTILG